MRQPAIPAAPVIAAPAEIHAQHRLAPARERRSHVALLPLLLAAALAPSLAGAQAYPVGYGPQPKLPEPESKLVPTVNVAPAAPWSSAQEAPVPAAGFSVSAYARDLDHPRWVYTLPNGDVLVAETNAPPKPDDGKGIKGAVMKHMQKKAGAVSESANRITLLRGIDANGGAQSRHVFLSGLNSPFGMAVVGNYLYVANTDAVLRFPYKAGATSIGEPGVKVMDLPAGTLNHHWTKNLVASPDGKFLYVTVGSNSNVAENGMDAEQGRAAIWQLELATSKSKLFATGLRNPNGMDFEPRTKALWTAVNERDELGNDLVPDYMTSVREGGFYGWPYSYFGQHVDTRVKPQKPELVAKAIVPDYALGGHTASLGLAFYNGKLFPQSYQGGVFIGQHGSWNRKPHSGYKVVFIPFSNGKPAGPPQDFLAGFLDKDGKARGRPVGVAVDQQGALLVADDVGNVIWRVAPGAAAPAQTASR